MSTEVDDGPANGSRDRAEPPPSPTRGRRELLRLGGAAIVGTAAATLLPQRAAADNGLAVTSGVATTSDAPTMVSYTGSATSGAYFLFRGPNVSAAPATAPSAVLAGVASDDTTWMAGVAGFHEGEGPGVLAGSAFGVALEVGATEFADHLRFNLSSGYAHPADRPNKSSTEGTLTAFHSALGKSLWYCSSGGTPGSWRKVAGPGTSGAFHAISTARIYDSRMSQAGRIVHGSTRQVIAKDKLDPTTGTVLSHDVVPFRATAITYNLTVTSTVGSGYLAVEPGDVSTPGGSIINWANSGVTVANASVIKLDDGNGQTINVFAGGVVGSSAHFVVDVTGYYI